jgi:GTP-binding protein
METKGLKVLAIVGRPNVGKSTLFNRIVGKAKAITHNTPGVTRDRIYAEAEYLNKRFIVIDTGGFDPTAESGLLSLLRAQVSTAISEADALLFVVDGKEGLTALDEEVYEHIRKAGKKVFVVVNKIDRPEQAFFASDFYGLGVEELFLLSAEKGSGVAELLDRVISDLSISETEETKTNGVIRIAIVGRPNVGKSTLANALLGEERFLTSDEPGTTVDSVDERLFFDGREFMIVDTAGIRRKAKIEEGLERMGVQRALWAIQRSDVVLLVIDASEGVTSQDKTLASFALEKGKGVCLVLNKWDAVQGDKNLFLKTLRYEFAFAPFLPHLCVSALFKKNTHEILPLVLKIYQNLHRRIPTSELNRFYAEVIVPNPPQGLQGVIKYVTQVDVAPPQIVLFCGAKKIKAQYLRFIQNALRKRYDFLGVPIRLVVR